MTTMISGNKVDIKPAAHRQTRYEASPKLDPPEVLPMPLPTRDLQQAKSDLSVYGLCLLESTLAEEDLENLRTSLAAQASAERALGEQAPPGADSPQQLLSNMVNKGAHFLDLVLRDEVDELCGFLLG
ncbi:MAG: hypothetical protein P8L31_06775, partial [Pseudomonadales bacterium]|nr:hypothetical protein [Pseudomonadales bacterium]